MINGVTIWRISNWFYRIKIPFFPALFMGILFYLHNSKVPYKVKIGKKTKFAYGGIGLLIVTNTEIGDNCMIGANVSIVRQFPYKNVPKIGNNVYIGPGAVISGPVIIEDDVIIAPNAVVTKSVPKGSIVGGIPAKILKNIKELDYNILDNPKFKEGTAEFLS